MQNAQCNDARIWRRREFVGSLGLAALGAAWPGGSSASRLASTASAKQPADETGSQGLAGATESASPELAFDPAAGFSEWQQRLRRRLVEIMALPSGPHAPLDAEIEREAKIDDYTIDRIAFTSEPGERVPGYVLWPQRGRPPFPVMICLQGHSPGMHISIGRATNERERRLIEGGRDLALQAVAHGWAAIVIEQRAFGLRRQQDLHCRDVSLRMLMLGRPITGGRVLDVMRTIDFVATQPDLDGGRIGCMGNSAGGTVSFYAACVDPRIRLAVVSSSFGPFADTWLWAPHCACGYLPGLYAVADMPDLAGLIAPRHLLIVAGKEDRLARFEGVINGVERARQTFAAAGVPEHVRLLAGDGGHRFYPELAWPAINTVAASW